MNKYMKIAKELSDENLITNVGGPFGACVVKDGKIIGKGSNHVLSNNNPTDNNTLNLESLDREETIKSFNKFEEKSDKIIY